MGCLATALATGTPSFLSAGNKIFCLFVFVFLIELIFSPVSSRADLPPGTAPGAVRSRKRVGRGRATQVQLPPWSHRGLEHAEEHLQVNQKQDIGHMWPGIGILHFWHACFLLWHSKLRPEVKYRPSNITEIYRNSNSRHRAGTSSQKLAINSSFICKQSAFSIRHSFCFPGTVSPKLAKQASFHHYLELSRQTVLFFPIPPLKTFLQRGWVTIVWWREQAWAASRSCFL